MRIDRVELRDFGSHRHTVLEPGDARLVVITGPNGIGKTTLASEALGHALYKDDRGPVGSSVRNGAMESVVQVDFTFGGRAYRAIRRRTQRAGGKSSADLQVREADGSWSPVASGDREVPAAVAELLRMDANTFRTSVSLAQKDLDRFVAAKATGRKELLASIVVDPRFAPAAVAAAADARTREAALRPDREAAERLDDAIAELAPVEAILEARRADAAAIETTHAASVSARNDAETRLRAVEVQLAESAVDPAEIARVEGEIGTLATRYRDVRGRWLTAQGAAERAVAAIVEGATAEEAAAELPDRLEDLAAMESLRDEDVRAEAALRTRREAHAAASADHRQAAATWQAEYTAARTRVDELAAALAALQPVACPKCGTEVMPGRSDLLARKDEAYAAFLAIEATQPPKEPMDIAREAAALVRLEARRRELGYDAAAHQALAATVRRLEQAAARAGSVADARTSLAEAEATIAAADAEAAQISEAGQDARERLEALTARQASQGDLRVSRDATAADVAALRNELDELEGRRRSTAAAIARLEADVERLVGLRADRAHLEAAMARAEAELERVRKVAGALGLKGIPARVIESVLPELGREANEVLGALFGMRLELRAQRATADGKGIVEALDLVVTKDGTGEVPLERVSGGQETAVSLSLAIGLSRLNARRAGTAIRTLVVDEPDGLDVERRRALGAALRTLAHQGELERVVVITHAPELAEFGDLVVELREGHDGVEQYVDGIRLDPDAPAAIAA